MSSSNNIKKSKFSLSKKENRRNHYRNRHPQSLFESQRDNYDMRILRPSSFTTMSLNYVHIFRRGL